ncbi:tail fiber protein [Aeromonas phage T7-Ah]|uniref:Tail fiber protein n=1 Tax=Aeromonas phage T7-Ah TaxID=2759196 RepID=A0A7S6HSC0_9CAUD|nr:tail fiber protein [Aeromonas phage T7-Ah]
MADAFFTRAPSTIVTMAINGQTEFTIPFEFLARKFVVVTLLGVDRKVLTMNTDYRFIAVNKIRLEQPAPAGYPRIELRRVTSTTDRLVTFIDGSILRATDLNLAQVQTMHVAEEARDLTSDTIGVNDEGHLDARNRKIVNLANATDHLDAVNLGQLRQFDDSTANNADKAQASATAAKVSETNAKNSENRSVVAEAKAVSSAGTAMTAASDANSSKLAAKQSEDIVVPLVPIVQQNAASAAQSAADAAQAVQDVKNLGAVPVGTIVMFGALPLPAGYISLMADNPTFDVTAYPELAQLYPTGKLPSYKDRVPEGVGSGITLGQKRAGSVGATSAITLQTNTVDLNHSHDFSGSTTSGGEHEHFINSLNQRYNSGVYPTIEYQDWRSPNPPNWTKTAIGGGHSHSVSGTTAGMKNGVGQQHNHTISGVVGSGRNLVDATGTIFAIKAFGAIVNEGSLDAPTLSNSIQLVNNRVSTLETAVGFGRKVPVGSLLIPAAGWTFGDAECSVQETSSGYIVRIIFRADSGITQRGMCYLAAGLKCIGYTSATVAVNGVLYPGYVEPISPNILSVAGAPAGAFSWVMATLTLEKT